MSGFARRLGDAFDGLVGVFSPLKAYRNQILRDVGTARHGERGYAAARVTPSTHDYWTGVGDPNSDIRESRDRVTRRVRQLVRDMPWMDEAVSASVAYKVGAGFSYKPAVRRSDGTLDTSLNETIKARFSAWCDHAEVNGRDNFGDVQRLLVRQMTEVGEALMLHRVVDGEYRLQVFEPDCIATNVQSDTVDMGIEFDPATNRFVNLRMRSLYSTPEERTKEFVVPFSQATFLYRTLRPWQRRGISPIVQCIFLAADLDTYVHGELAAQQMASRWLAFITSSSENSVSPNLKRREEPLENLTIEYMPDDKNVQLAPGVARPTTGLESFKNMFLKLLATKLNVPYHLLSQDYSGLNYNTLREMRINFVHTMKPEWEYFTSHVLRDVYRRWMDVEVLSGRLTLPGYWSDEGQMRYRQCFWMPPGMESVDVLRDIKGVITAAQAGMYDPQDWIMAQGEDPEEILDGLAEFQRKLKERGIEASAWTPTIADKDTGDTELEK